MSRACISCGAEIADNNNFCPKCGVNQIANNMPEFIPTLEVTRESCFISCLQSFRVFVDDKEIGRLKNGEKKRFQITPGLHEIRIKVNWSWLSSPKESFLHKDFTKFSCRPRIGVLGAIFKMPIYLLFKWRKFVQIKQG